LLALRLFIDLGVPGSLSHLDFLGEVVEAPDAIFGVQYWKVQVTGVLRLGVVLDHDDLANAGVGCSFC